MAEELIDEFGEDIDAITLVKGSNGRFEVTVNGQQIFSKKDAGRHANQGEIVDIIARMTGPHGQQSGPAAHA